MQQAGDDLVLRLCALYMMHAPVLLERLQDCEAAPRDFARFASAAHVLKSISRTVGVVRVAELCGAVEEAARDGIATLESSRTEITAAVTERVAELSGHGAVVPEPCALLSA